MSLPGRYIFLCISLFHVRQKDMAMDNGNCVTIITSFQIVGGKNEKMMTFVVRRNMV